MAGSDELSKTQIDRLGDRLRKGSIHEDDLRLLDIYRRSFSDAYEDVVGRIRDLLKLEPTGRPAKSTTSIIDKLRRESIRLSQVQDIAGGRLVVADLKHQDDVVDRVTRIFERTTVVDRREHPSHGYRAVHLIVGFGSKLIEIQVRTALQHQWAELSEKLSDVVDNAIKYGGGDEEVVSLLVDTSNIILAHEKGVAELQKMSRRIIDFPSDLGDDVRQLILELDQDVVKETERMGLQRQRVVEALNQMSEVIPRVRGQKDAISD